MSIPYLRADIKILAPEIIILPKTLYDINKKSFDKVCGNAIIIPIYQINAGIVNRTIFPNPKYPHYNIEKLSPTIQTWYDQLKQDGITGKTKENFLSVFFLSG